MYYNEILFYKLCIRVYSTTITVGKGSVLVFKHPPTHTQIKDKTILK